MQAIRAISARNAVIATGLTLALSGCISFGGKPPPTLYSLTPASTAPSGTTISGRLSDAIVVMDPETDQRLAVLRVPVQVDDSNVAYLKNAQWIARPARLFRGLLAETLRAKGSRLVLEGDETEAQGRLRLSGRLRDMGYDARNQSVVVRFDAMKQAGANGAIEVKRFEAVEPGIGAKPELVGPALNRAANSVAAQVADWVG